MDLNDEAQRALERTLVEQNLVLPYVAQAIARQMWLQGYKAGMDATKVLAEKAFDRLERSL